MNGYPWGGSEELWYNTALLLAEKGASVACAVYDWPGKKVKMERLQQAGCTIYFLPNKKTLNAAAVKKTVQKMRRKMQLRAAVKALPLLQYDVVIINQGGYEIYTSPWRKLQQQLKNYVLLFHNYNANQRFSVGQKESLTRWLQGAKANLFAASRMIVVLEQKLSITIPHAAAFINPITFQPPASLTAYPALQNGNFILVVFAALDVSRKAQDKLIDVLSAQKWRSRNWQLFLYGEGGDRAYLQELIIEKELSTNVLLKGHTSSVASAMQEAHLVLQITNIDAMPLSVIEAMAMSRAVVVSRTGDMPLWVLPGENGWVCYANKEDIDATLERAWQQREQWEVMGRRSFALFKEKFPASPEENFIRQIERALSIPES